MRLGAASGAMLALWSLGCSNSGTKTTTADLAPVADMATTDQAVPLDQAVAVDQAVAIDQAVPAEDLATADLLPSGDLLGIDLLPPPVDRLPPPDLLVRFTLAATDAGVFADYTTRNNLGFQFGFADGVLGAVSGPNHTVMFGSAFSAPAAKCSGTPSTQGIYRIYAEPDDPATLDNARCVALLSPEGGNLDGGTTGPFDRNYLGGGPALRVTNPSDSSKTGILVVYHAEFQWGPKCTGGAPCFFGTLGMGLSTDGGTTMTRLGQIIQPYPKRSDWVAQPTSTSLSIGDGPFVVGDIDGLAVDPRTADPTTTYFYVYFPDYDAAGKPGLAVARALQSNVITAAFAGNTAAFPTLFHKYYNPGGALAIRNAFTQAGVSSDTINNNQSSGLFTPLLTKAFSPTLMYDASVRQVLLASTTQNAGVEIIELRASPNVVQWTQTPVLVTIDESGGATATEVRYPSLIGDQPERSAGGLSPYLFYSHEPTATPTWPNTTLVVRRLPITIP